MKTKTLIYFPLKKIQHFNDGFSTKQGDIVRYIENEGEMYNVELVDGNIKRMFWVHITDLNIEKKKVKKEKWSEKKYLISNLDLNEKWLEFEQGNVNSSGKNLARKKPIRKTKVAVTVGRSKRKVQPRTKKAAVKRRTTTTRKKV